MKTKYTLILCAILLATAAISGCTDADAPDTTFNEQTVQKLLDEDTPINDIYDTISAVADSKNYDVDVVRSDNTGKIVSIGVDDNKGNNAMFINADANPDVDKAILNNIEIHPTTGEAESPQTQLSDEPNTDALYKQITNPDIIRGAMDQPLDNYRIPASILGAPDREASNGNTWLNVAGFEKYIEYVDDADNVKKIEFEDNDGNIIQLANQKQNDKNIDALWANLKNTGIISLP